MENLKSLNTELVWTIHITPMQASKLVPFVRQRVKLNPSGTGYGRNSNMWLKNFPDDVAGSKLKLFFLKYSYHKESLFEGFPWLCLGFTEVMIS